MRRYTIRSSKLTYMRLISSAPSAAETSSSSTILRSALFKMLVKFPKKGDYFTNSLPMHVLPAPEEKKCKGYGDKRVSTHGVFGTGICNSVSLFCEAASWCQRLAVYKPGMMLGSTRVVGLWENDIGKSGRTLAKNIEESLNTRERLGVSILAKQRNRKSPRRDRHFCKKKGVFEWVNVIIHQTSWLRWERMRNQMRMNRQQPSSPFLWTIIFPFAPYYPSNCSSSVMCESDEC